MIEPIGMYPMPRHGWTCFFCGETFRTPGAARDHFGKTPLAQAACQIKAGEERGLVVALRKAEARIDKLEAALREKRETCQGYVALLDLLRKYAEDPDLDDHERLGLMKEALWLTDAEIAGALAGLYTDQRHRDSGAGLASARMRINQLEQEIAEIYAAKKAIWP